MHKSHRITATEYSHNRGLYLEEAHAGYDVIVERNKRPTAVLIPYERYAKFLAFEEVMENAYWNDQAEEAVADLLSKEEADELTKKLLQVIKE